MKQPELTYYSMGSDVTAFSTTRHGGYSEGKYGAFNINVYCGDDPMAVRSNRAALCRLLGVEDGRLVMPHQTHQTQTVAIDEPFLSLLPDERRLRLEGVDALMTDVADVCIGVSTADCIPVLLYDSEHHAVGAVHAGWRGTVARIVEHTVAAMTAAYGTRPSQLKAQIGPGISLESFEVGDEVYEAFATAGFSMPPISRHIRGKWHLDLPECNRQQLIGLGVPAQAVQVSDVCTYQQSDRYFSARKLGIQSGRIFTGVLLKAKRS